MDFRVTKEILKKAKSFIKKEKNWCKNKMFIAPESDKNINIYDVLGNLLKPGISSNYYPEINLDYLKDCQFCAEGARRVAREIFDNPVGDHSYQILDDACDKMYHDGDLPSEFNGYGIACHEIINDSCDHKTVLAMFDCAIEICDDRMKK